MSDLIILVVEDEPEVRDAILRDLAPFEARFRIEATQDTAEAREVVHECAALGDTIALILCDHILPGQNGIDFLIELQSDAAFADIRKILITGQAGLEDTIQAINRANLDHYIAKPWEQDALQDVVRHQMTEFVLARGKDLLKYVDTLDGPRILDAISRGDISE